jgi:membrane protease subunit HflK
MGTFFGAHILKILIGLVGLVVIATTYYQVEPDEVGVVTRFGAYTRLSDPGPHFKLPLGVERVTNVPVQRQLKQEFGFRTLKADVRTEYARPDDAAAEATMLTGDLNVADVEWIVQYKIRDPYKYLFMVLDVEATFRDINESTMRQVIGDRSVTEVLTIGREEIQVAAKETLQEFCNRYEMGIEVLQLVLQDVNPPEAVRASFNEVNQAIQERERAINEARAEYNRVIPAARGKALQAVQAAEGYAMERVNRAKGDAERFRAVQTQYAKAREVTRARLYLETLGKVLPKAGRRLLLDADLKGLLPLLPLGEAMARRAPAPAPAAAAKKGGAK